MLDKNAERELMVQQIELLKTRQEFDVKFSGSWGKFIGMTQEWINQYLIEHPEQTITSIEPTRTPGWQVMQDMIDWPNSVTNG